MRYVAIGDSLTRGFRVGVPLRHRDDSAVRTLVSPMLSAFDRPSEGYPALVAGVLRRRGVAVDLDMELTCSGAGTDTLWHGDGPVPALRRVMEGGADLVTVTLGANDMADLWMLYVPGALVVRPLARLAGFDPQAVLDALAPPRARTRERVAGTEARLRALLGWIIGAGARTVLVTTYYNADGSRTVQTRFTDPLSEAVRRATGDLPAAHVVDLDSWLAGGHAHGDWVCPWDGFHLTAVGQRAAADAVLASLAGLPGPWRT